MIVMLALLNDGAILSIAYDKVHYKNQPEAWNMRLVLGISTVLGIIGVVAAFGLFYLGERVFHLDRSHIQTLMYLKLSVAGHLTIFLTRTRGPFWSIRPARILWGAVLGTQVVATLIAVYGLFMTPLGWGWALFVWGYALAWFLVNDRVKLLAYQFFDPVKGKPKAEAKTEAEPQPDVKAAPQSDAKAALTADAKAEPKPDPKAPPKSEAKVEPKADAQGELEPEGKAAPQSEAKAEPKPQSNATSASLLNTTLGDLLVAGLVKDPEDAGRIIAAAITQAGASIAAAKAPEADAAPQPEAKAAPKSEAKVESKPVAKAEPRPDPEPKREAKAKTPSDSAPEPAK